MAQTEIISRLRRQVSSKDEQIETLNRKLKNVPNVSKVKFGNEKKIDASEIDELKAEIDRQNQVQGQNEENNLWEEVRDELQNTFKPFLEIISRTAIAARCLGLNLGQRYCLILGDLDFIVIYNSV